MAKNNLDPLVDKFLTRSRRRRRQPGLKTTTPNITGTSSSFRPVKLEVANNAARHDVANSAARYDVAQRRRKRKAY